MRKFLTGLALLASVSAQAQTPTRGQHGYDTGAIVTCNDPNTGGTSRCLMPGTITYDPSGVPIGTAANPIFVNSGGGGDVQGTGTLALATINATYSFPLSGGRNAVGLTINGLTGSGATITVERSNDGGTTWTNANTTEGTATSSLSPTITVNGQARVGVAGATNLRIRVSTIGTGTATVTYNATTAAGPVFLTSTIPQVNGSIGGVSGDTASGATDAGNPVKIGCGVSDLSTTFTNGQRATLMCDTKGGAYTVIKDPFGTNAATISPAYFGSAASINTLALNTNAFNKVYTGSGYLPASGDATGAFVVSKGSATLATGQVSVGTTATLIRAADAGRTSITVIVGAANACAFGNSGVTATTGYLLPATAGATDTTATSAALYGVCAAATTVSYKAILP